MNKFFHVAGIISSSREAPSWHHIHAIVGLLRSQHDELPLPSGFLTGRSNFGMTHLDMNFEILRPCCSMSSLTLTLRHDTGNRPLDYAICHAIIEPAYKFGCDRLPPLYLLDTSRSPVHHWPARVTSTKPPSFAPHITCFFPVCKPVFGLLKT